MPRLPEGKLIIVRSAASTRPGTGSVRTYIVRGEMGAEFNVTVPVSTDQQALGVEELRKLVDESTDGSIEVGKL